MSRGHGTLGLLDRQKTFAGLAGASSGVSRRSYLEIRLGLALTGWTASGSNWTRTVTAAELTHAGVIRPIVGAESLIHPRPLVRMEQVSDMVAGTWHFDDDALVAGGSATMTVRLPTATDPDASTAGLVAQLLFCAGGGDEHGDAEVHPLLGDNKYTNAGIETWGGGNPTGWTEYGAGAAQETTVVLDGLSSARIGSAAIGAGALDGFGQSKVGVQGAYYRVSGYYLTPLTGQSADVEVRLRVGVSGSWLTRDGHTLTAVDGGFRVRDTYGEKRRFVYDFIWTGATAADVQADILLTNTAGAARAGLLYVDRMSFRPIHRWNAYETRLSGASIPELSIQSQSILFGAKTIGFGSVTLLDGDGEMAKAFASLLVLQKPASIYVGGSFRNGDEIHRDDWRAQFSALIRKPEVSPGEIMLELEDGRSLAKADAIERAHRVADQASMSRSQEGLQKPLMFGTPWDDDGVTLQHIVPGVRVGLTADDYGEYVQLDPFIPVRDNVDVDVPANPSIKVFPNSELADANLKGYVITDDVNDFELDDNDTLWRILRDVRNMRYDPAGNDVGTGLSFVFDTELSGGPGDLNVNLSLEGPPYLNAANLQAAMRAAVGGGDTATNVTYDESTHLFTVERTGGGKTLNLRMTSTTTNRAHVSGWKYLGYDTREDKTGATSYTSDEPIFTAADTDHVIRFPGGGYRDDAAGSICGVPDVAIDSWPAVASWLLQKRLNVPASMIDIPSFMAARDTSRSNDFAVLFAHLDDGDVLRWLAIAEQVGVMNLVQDGDGVWRCIKHAAGSAGAVEFFDDDYIEGSWRMWLDPTAVYRDVKIHGDYNPSRKRFTTYGAAPAVLDPLIPIKHGEERILEIESYIERQYIVGGDERISPYYSRLIGKTPRVATFESTSKLVDRLPGYKVILNRTLPGVLDPTGALTAVPFRIVDLTHRYSTTGVSRCVVVEDVTFLS